MKFSKCAMILGFGTFLAFSSNVTAQQNITKEEQISGIVESTSATVRCDEGTVVTGGYESTASDVIVDTQGAVDCDSGCRAWQVNAHRETQDPFDLQVWVECTTQ